MDVLRARESRSLILLPSLVLSRPRPFLRQQLSKAVSFELGVELYDRPTQGAAIIGPLSQPALPLLRYMCLLALGQECLFCPSFRQSPGQARNEFLVETRPSFSQHTGHIRHPCLERIFRRRHNFTRGCNLAPESLGQVASLSVEWRCNIGGMRAVLGRIQACLDSTLGAGAPVQEYTSRMLYQQSQFWR